MTNFKIKIKIIFFFITICNSAIYSQEGSVLIKKDSTLIKIVELRNVVNSEIYDKNREVGIYRCGDNFIQNDSEVKTISVSKVFDTIVKNL